MELAGNARDFSFVRADRGVKLSCTVSAQEPTVNPELLVKALEQLDCALKPDFAGFTRTETLNREFKPFR